MAKFLDENGMLYFWSKIKAALLGKVDKVDGKGLSANDYTTAEKNKLGGIAANANNYTHPTQAENAAGFYKIGNDAAGHIVVGAAIAKDDITRLGIPEQDTTYLSATPAANGLMSAADKAKLNGVAANANNYTLPVATPTTLGGVKVDGSTVVINNGIISAAGGVTFARVTTLPATGATGIIYLLSVSGAAQNVYDEYIWCDVSGSGTMGWEKIGTTAIDLSGYWRKADLFAITNAEIDSILAS